MDGRQEEINISPCQRFAILGDICKIDGLFVAIGLEPKNSAFSTVAGLDENGYFNSDESCVTKSQGIFVAGDCRQKRIRQITTASADGAVAALAACRYIDNM